MKNEISKIFLKNIISKGKINVTFTALVITIFSIIVTILSFLLRVIIFWYNVGYCSYFDIPIEYISIDFSSYHISLLLLSILIILLLICSTLFGVEMINAKHSIKYFVFLYVLSLFFVAVIEIVYLEKPINDIIDFNRLPVLLSLTAMVTVYLSMVIISMMITNSKYTTKHKTTAKHKTIFKNEKKLFYSVKITIVLFFFIVVLTMFYINIIGRMSAKNKKDFYFIHMNPYDYVQLYSENDFIVIAPYIIKNDMLSIAYNCKMKIMNNNVKQIKMTFLKFDFYFENNY